MKTLLLITLLLLSGCHEPVWAMELTASWYSVESLKAEGTYKDSQGITASGTVFADNDMTCATRLYPLGSLVCVTNIENNKKVYVEVTDRIGKRFANTRIDLSKKAFSNIAGLEQGIIRVRVEKID